MLTKTLTATVTETDDGYAAFERWVAERVADATVPLFTTDVNPDSLWAAYLIEAGANADEAGMPLLRAIIDDVLRTVRTTRESLKVARFGLTYNMGVTTFEEDLNDG